MLSNALVVLKPELLDPPMWLDDHGGKTYIYRFEDENLDDYDIFVSKDDNDGMGSYVIQSPNSTGWRRTLVEAHASLCQTAYYAGILTDEKWMNPCDGCGNDVIADLGRWLSDDVWGTIAYPDQVLCNACIDRRLARSQEKETAAKRKQDMNLTERFTRYLITIDCRSCPDKVYPHEDTTRTIVEYLIEHEEIRTIDDLRSRANRTCDAWVHGLEKED